MPNVAAIDAMTGPGKRVSLFVGDVEEITFRLKKKVIEVVNSRGEYGSYDLAQIKEITISMDDKDLTLSVESKEDIDDRSNPEAPSAKPDDAIEGVFVTEAERIAAAADTTERFAKGTIPPGPPQGASNKPAASR